MEKTILIVLIACLSLWAFSPKNESKKYVTLVTNDANKISSYIQMYSKYGYEVESITPQSVSITSYNGRSRENGNLILLMSK